MKIKASFGTLFIVFNIFGGNMHLPISKKAVLIICTITLAVLCFVIYEFAVPGYKLDYSGEKNSFIGAASKYKAGQTVRLIYPNSSIGTDTDYYFYLDGKKVSSTYVGRIGFIIKFKMPKHDAVFKMKQKNTMTRG